MTRFPNDKVPPGLGFAGPVPDWPKPPDCLCNTLREAQACYERCDDSMQEPKERTLWGILRDFFIGGDK